MANYDNSRYTYEQVLSGTGVYRRDDALKYSSGVLTMQEKLNKAGFWCGATPDGKFGIATEEAVQHFQRAYGIVASGIGNNITLKKLDEVSAVSPGYTKTSGTYGIYFDSMNKRFLYNQQVVYLFLKADGLSNVAMAGIMGNIQAESEFRTTWNTSGASGICRWLTDRRDKLAIFAQAIQKERTAIDVQAAFVIQEGKDGTDYTDFYCVQCFNALKDAGKVKTVQAVADYFMALDERCECYATWSEAQSSKYDISRFSSVGNAYNGKFYLDAPKRRGYAETYYTYLQTL